MFLRTALDTLLARRRTLSALRPGLVTVTGVARAEGDPLRAPISGAECLWWRYTLQHRVRSPSSGGSGRAWRTQARGATHRGFLIADGADQARIDLRDAEVSGVQTCVVAARSLPHLTLAQLERLPTVVPRGESPSGRVPKQVRLSELDGEWQVVESHLPLGSEIWVRGVARTTTGAGWELTGLTSFPVLVSTGGAAQGTGLKSATTAVPLVIGLGAWYAAVVEVVLLGGNGFALVLAVLPVVACAAALTSSWRRSRRIPRLVE